MSVIIRLQNLPWNANALDIRRFFQGLAIPDGGVHIIGGEKGDAFIAFGTDEDARQAMMKDAGRINGFAVKLLLSSKTEMQNVIAAAKGGPPPPLPAASSMGIPKPGGFYDRPVIPPVVGAQVPFVGGTGGGDVTGSGQGLRSSTGLGTLTVPYGYPGNSSQVVPAQPQPQPAGYVVRMNEPRPVVPAAPAMPPPAPARSFFDNRPSDRPPVPGSLQQPPAVPVDPLAPGLHPAAPGLPPVAGWTTTQPPMSRDIPPPDFGRSTDIPGAQGVGFNTFNREPVRQDGGRVDLNYQRNGRDHGAPESGRNFIPGVEAGRNLGPNLGPPPDVGRDFGRGDGRPEERRDTGRFVDGGRGWGDRNPPRAESGPGQSWSGGGRSFGGRDVEHDSRREFPRSDADRGISAPDRWLEGRNMGPDRGSRDMPAEESRLRPGAGNLGDRFGITRPDVFPEHSGSRFGPDSGPPGMGGIPDSRLRGDSRAEFARPDPGFRGEAPRPLMEEQLRRPPPLPEQQWMDDRRGHGPPPPGFDRRPPSPPRDYRFPGGFPPRDEPWHDERRDFDPRQMRDPGPNMSLSICAVNFPRSFNYREVRRFFNGCDIPHDGVKLINDRMGLRTGVVFVRVADMRSLDAAMSKHGKVVESNRISIERCSDHEFDMAVDGVPLKRNARSRSPRSRQADEDSNISYFVLKKLPAKTEKDDIRKFLGKFRIAADGGPFFELAFDKSQTGNALVAVEEKDASKVVLLHRNMLNGSRVDVVKINSYEYEERSRRARQCERDADKNVGQSKPTPLFSRDKKPEKQDSKSKELDRSGTLVGDDDGRQQSGSDERTYCVELRGIPYTASPSIIQDFFREINIPVDCIHVVYNREHRATGIAYIEFSSMTDQKKALEKDKQHMGHRLIEIRALGRTAMVAEYNKQQQKFGGAQINMPSARSGSKGLGFLLSMQNLHFDTQLEDILDFFAGYRPIVDSIQLQYKDNQPTGDGLVAFESLQEAESALRSKNRYMLRGKPVTLAWPKN